MKGRTNYHHSRHRDFTNLVYGGAEVDRQQLAEVQGELQRTPDSEYNVYFGEIHGHTALSDGQGTLDEYFTVARDEAELDFCAVTDHDHGAPGCPELWGDKWEQTQQKVAEYHDPPSFITLLGYERDSFPYYPNMCVYYRDGRGEMIRGEQDGEITAEELAALAARDDVLFIPHQISQIEVGVNWKAVPMELMPPVTEVYSKWGASEYFGNARPIRSHARGNFWRDALQLGAKVGCIGGSDVHAPYPGIPAPTTPNLRWEQPGIAAVLAQALSREAIFEAIKSRRCYCCEGARAKLDFRISDHYMGDEFAEAGEPERRIYVAVDAPEAIEYVSVVKNARDHFRWHLPGTAHEEQFEAHIVDLEAERDTDYYYVRITLKDGRRVWSSPIWVDRPGSG